MEMLATAVDWPRWWLPFVEHGIGADHRVQGEPDGTCRRQEAFERGADVLLQGGCIGKELADSLKHEA